MTEKRSEESSRPAHDPKGSRYEMNQRVKMILVRHGVNLMVLRWSSSQRTTYFYGTLRKDTDEEFTVQSLEALVKELLNMPRGHRVRFHLENWDIGSESESLKITKKKKAVESSGPAERGQTVIIHRAEKPMRRPEKRTEAERTAQEAVDPSDQGQ